MFTNGLITSTIKSIEVPSFIFKIDKLLHNFNKKNLLDIFANTLIASTIKSIKAMKVPKFKIFILIYCLLLIFSVCIVK